MDKIQAVHDERWDFKFQQRLSFATFVSCTSSTNSTMNFDEIEEQVQFTLFYSVYSKEQASHCIQLGWHPLFLECMALIAH